MLFLIFTPPRAIRRLFYGPLFPLSGIFPLIFGASIMRR
jgi:hypothetical protein